MTLYVFTGPSLPPEAARAELDAVFLPPVAQGDVIAAVRKAPKAIGIIDGFFENVPAVWHKEILHALKSGIAVFGAASMGALRAAELAPFGMEGVGAVYKAYREGLIEDDDEVAVLHGPAELGYPLLSEAMVNIRRTLSDARMQGIVGETTHGRLEAIAKQLSYRDRKYGTIFRLAEAEPALRAELEAFTRWLPGGRVDQKREDALLMLRRMRAWSEQPTAPTARFNFERTLLWEQAVARRSAAA